MAAISSRTSDAGRAAATAPLAAPPAAGGGEGPIPDPAAGWTGSVEALPAGGERVSSPATPAWGENGDGRLVERLRVGGGVAVDGSPGPTFGPIPDLAPTPDGGAWILDGEARGVARVDGGRWCGISSPAPRLEVAKQ